MLLARFAQLAAPLLDQLSTHVEGQQLLEEPEQAQLFRAEAVQALTARNWGDVMRVSPSWVSWLYWALVALLLGSVAFLTFGTLATYSAGPAVIRSMARTSITSRTAGNVTAIEVVPGDRVAAGATIVRLDDVDQRAAVDRLRREFESQLRNHMADPADATADGSLRALRQQLDQARTALEERSIRVPVAGVISDIRVRPGQHVEPGDVAASTVDGSAALEVVALMPGEDRPQLAPGMGLRVELDGYRYAYQTLVIDSVSSDVIAPNEARRVLGAEVAESMKLGGPVVLVRGRLPSSAFEVDGRTYHYHDGMLGTAEVRVDEERIVYALFPGLRRL
jgi:multidrug resistance efflux pump